MATWVVCRISYDYYEFCEVLYAGTPAKVKSWLKKHPQEVPIVLPDEELPFEVTHYPLNRSFNAGNKRPEPAIHIRIEEFK